MPKKRHRLSKLRLNEISLVDFGADTNATISIFKRADETPATTEAAMADQTNVAAQLADAAAVISDLTKRVETAEAKIAEADKARDDAVAMLAKAAKKKVAEAEAEDPEAMAEDDDAEDVLAKVKDPAVVAEIVALRKSNARWQKQMGQIAEGEAIKKAIQKVEAELPNLPVPAAELGPVIKRISEKLDDDDADLLMKVLKAGDAAIANAAEMVGFGGAAPSSAEAALDEIAKGIAQTENVSFAKASTVAMERNPELYTAILRERGEVN